MNNIFNADRKILYIVLCIVFVFVSTLTIVYAALSSSLNITGNSEVVASNWDIYLDNVQLMSSSVTKNVPIIVDKKTVSFTTTLTNPGDYYIFTVDVVNNGSIDAMIESIKKTPTLTTEQAKYLNYIIEYQNGESINKRQLVEANSFVRLKVKVEFRKDISASDLPTTTETLDLSFIVKYIQTDENETSNVIDHGILTKVVDGDYDTVGSEVCIGEECFYVISSTEDTVTMLAKYNLYAGGEYIRGSLNWVSYGNQATYKQDSQYYGSNPTTNIVKGAIAFSSDYYWKDIVSSYPSYVYNSNSNIYESLEKYKNILEESGVFINEVRLIKKEELDNLGCSISTKTCTTSIYEWVYTTSYWTGTAYNEQYVYRVRLDGVYSNTGFNATANTGYGVRPVIVINKTQFKEPF